MSGRWAKVRVLALGLVLLLAAACTGLSAIGRDGPAATPTVAAADAPPGQPFGARTRASGCVVHDGLPDSACTPGAIFPDATTDQICKPGYSASVRSVPVDVSRAVYAAYGIAEHASGSYEVDHLVPLEIGGSNDLANLWPQAGEPPPGFHQKDQVEDYLRGQVCAGRLALLDAQRLAATDWIAVYAQIPRTPTAASPTVSDPSGTGTIRNLSVTGAAPGGQASASARTDPGATCSIAYTTPAGTASRAPGLTPRTADASGTVAWTWTIGASTRTGTGTVAVTCNGATARMPIRVG